MNTMTKGPESETAQTGLHLYAACRPEMPLPEGPGVAGAAVELLADGPVALLASPLPSLDDSGREGLEAHARVVEQAFGLGVILPLRFPTVAPCRADTVTEFLRPRRRSILRALDRLEGREEVRVRATYQEELAVAELLDTVPRLARLRGRSEARLALGEAIVSELRHRARRDAEGVLKLLRPLTVDVMIDALGGEREVLVASLLTPRGSAERVAETVEQWASGHPAVQVKVYGPLPPYSFADFE